MIQSLRLQNFKCFGDQTIDFGKLTLLSGLNGMGKSTMLQFLLLLRQSHQQGVLASEGIISNVGLALNGDLVRLGTARDVLFEGAQENKICFDLICEDGITANGQFKYDAEADWLGADTFTMRMGFYKISLFTDDFHYLQAERIGPRTSFPVSDYIVGKHHQIGNQGEYTAHFLSVYGSEEVAIESLLRTDARSRNLIHQVEAWMSIISPGIRIELQPYKGMDIVNLEYAFAMGRQVSNAYRATNVGFGITYTLPVLVAILASKPGSLILLENPEAHLHPRGQAYIGELLARAASSDVQVLVETHSDHVLNGIRIAVHAGSIPQNDVSLYYFRRQAEEAQLNPEVVALHIDRNGRIDQWPEGFFDELDKSLSVLMEPAEE